MYDLLLKGGRLYDGSGLPGFYADVGVAGGKIVDIGRLNGNAKRTLTVDGLAVAAGFMIRPRNSTPSCSGTRWGHHATFIT